MGWEIDALRLRVFGVLTVLFVTLAGCTSEGYQADADVYRLRHLKYYVGLIDEYHEATGRVPLQGEADAHIVVNIVHELQREHAHPAPKTEHVVISFAEWVQDVEKVLGREIDELYEPQHYVYQKPLGYTYYVNGPAYFLTVPLHNGYGFATQVGDDYFEIKVSNFPGPWNGAISPEELFESEAFQAAVGRTVSRPGTFEKRRREFLHHSKENPPDERVHVQSREQELGALEHACDSEEPPDFDTLSMRSPNNILVSEYFIRVIPRRGVLHFKEYDLKAEANSPEPQTIASDLRQLLETEQYLVSEYGFEVFEPVEHSAFPDRDFLTGQHVLTTSVRNLGPLIRDSFGKILKRPVTVKITTETIAVRFSAHGLRVSTNNSLGVFANETDITICYRNGVSTYEAVIRMSDWEDGVSLAPWITEKILRESY